MQVVGYIRVSTEEQATSGQSLEAQTAKIKGYCDLYDLELVEIIVDAGQSAKSLNRPGIQQALKLLDSGVAGGLVIAKLDRLTRNVADWQTLIDGYFGDKAGKQLFSVGDSIDTRTAAGRLVLNVLLSVAQWEREAIGERTRDALAVKIKNRQRVGKIRYGFDLGQDGKSLIENPQEQAVLIRIQTMRNEGLSFPKIADRLNSENVPTKEGKTWAPTTIWQIMKRVAA